MLFGLAGAIVIGLTLGLIGSGGSILTVPVLVYVLQHDEKTAIAESLAIVGIIAIFAAVPYARSRLIDWRAAFTFGVPGMAGTYLGAWLAAYVSGSVQLMVFASVLLIAAWFIWPRRDHHGDGDDATHRSSPATSNRHPIALIAVEGLAVGVLTGFVGVGGGFLVVPSLVVLAALPMRRAIGTSLVIIAMKSTSGFGKYLHVLDTHDLSVDWTTIALFAVLGSAGALLGRGLNDRLNQTLLQRGFAALLILMFVFIGVQLTMSMFR